IARGRGGGAMIDGIGNKIAKGDILDWLLPEGLRRLTVVVAHVAEGGLSMGTSGEQTEPELVVTLRIPVGNVRPGQEACLADFRCLRNPQSESLIDQLTGGKPS